MFEKCLTHTRSYENPYRGVAAAASVVRPDGNTWVLPLYWDGGQSWGLRMSPDTVGEWSWVVHSSDAGLDGQRGSFQCVASGLRGALRPMTGHPLHFEYQDGTPCWFFGDKAWRLLQSDPVKKLDHLSAMHHVDVRAAQGFTYMHTELAGTGGLYSTGNEGGAMIPDPGAEIINPAFFREVDSRVRHINEKGIVLGIVLLYATGSPSWKSLPDEEARRRFARYVVARYAAFHVVFIVTGEWQYMVTGIELFRAIGREIRRSDPHHRMTGIHPGPGPYFSSQEYAGDEWMSFGDYAQAYFAPDMQEANDWCRLDLRDFVRAARRHGKPVVDCEYAYYLRDQDFDGIVDKPNSHSRESFRRASWMFPMGGGYFVTGFGTTYFGGWREIGPFLVDNPRHADAIADLGRIRAFFTALQWWLLEPHDELCTPRGGIVFCMADLAATCVVYAVGSSGVEVMVGGRGLPGGRWQAVLFDPRTGERRELPAVTGPVISLDVPDMQDWVFLITKTAAS
jgi:hypothetical protein